MKKTIVTLLFLATCSIGSASVASTTKSTVRTIAPVLLKNSGAVANYSGSQKLVSQYPLPINPANQSFNQLQPLQRSYAIPAQQTLDAHKNTSFSESVSKYVAEAKAYLKEAANETEDFIQNEIGINIGYKTEAEKAFAAQAQERIQKFNRILEQADIYIPYETFIIEAAQHIQYPDQALGGLKKLGIHFAMINTQENPIWLLTSLHKESADKFAKFVHAVHELEQNIPSTKIGNDIVAIEADAVILHNLLYCLDQIQMSADSNKTVEERADIIHNMIFQVPAYPANPNIVVKSSSTVQGLHAVPSETQKNSFNIVFDNHGSESVLL